MTVDMDQKASKSSLFRDILMILFMSLLYYGLAYASMQFTRIHNNVSVFYIPTGFSIALLIHFGLKITPALFIGKMVYSFNQGYPLDQNIISTLASFSEAYVGYYLYHSFKKTIEDNFDFQSDLVLIAMISFLAPVISAMIGVTSLLYYGHITETNYFFNWLSWYTGDVLGAFIFLPAFIYSHIKASENDGDLKGKFKFHFLDFLAPLMAAAFTYIFQFEPLNPYIFAIFITMLLPALVGTSRSIFYSLITVALMLNYFQLMHTGPFSAGTYHENLTSMQFFLFALAATALAIEGFKKTGLMKAAILPLVSFWILTGSVYYYYHIQKDINDEKNLKSTISEFGNRLTEKMFFYNNALHGVAGFVSSSQEVSQREWEDYVNSISLVRAKDGIRTISLIYPESAKQKDLFFYDQTQPASLIFKDRTLLENPLIAEALNESMASSKLVMTKPTLFNLGPEKANISFIVMPVFKNAVFTGWVLSSIELSKIFSSIISNGFQKIDIDVYSGRNLSPENLLYRNIIDPRFRKDEDFDGRRISTLDFSGQQLTIYWNETTRFISLHNSQNSFFVLIGAIFSLVVTGFILNLRMLNIKAQKIADLKTRELSESEEKFKGLFNNSSDAVLLFNDHRILDCNPESLSVFGKHTKKEMMITHVPSLFVDDLDPDFFKKKMKDVKLHQMIAFECHCLRNEVPFVAEVHLHYLAFKDRFLYQAVVRDISERKKIETNLIKSKELAEDAARAKTEFLSTMSHEIRTPLNGVIGMIDVILDGNPDLSIKNDLNTIKYSADNLLHVVNGVLDYNKIEAGKMILEKKAFSLKFLCENILKIYTPKAVTKNIQLNLDFDENIPNWIEGDEYRNSQILHNLLSNALKFTHEGLVKLEVHLISKKEDYCQIRFKIIDTGIGIDPQKQAVIFKEFTQAESDHTRKYGGTGLGLAITKRLIEIQKGHLSLESQPGVGSVFTYTLSFTLPSQDEKIALNSNLVKSKKESSELFNGQRVLLVEDNDVNIFVTKKFLERWNLSVDMAMNGVEAVDKVRANSYALVLMDLHMPIMGGLEATSVIRSFNKNIPIIGLSADVMTDVTQDLKKTGMNNFVTKPFVPEDFIQIIRSYI